MELNEKDLDQISGGAVSSDGTKCEVKDGSIVKKCSHPNHKKVGVCYKKCGATEVKAEGFKERLEGYQDYICLNCGATWTKGGVKLGPHPVVAYGIMPPDNFPLNK